VLGSQTSANESEVIVVGMATTEIDLRLVAGTLLKIIVVDGDGKPRSSRISCTGTDGKDFSTWYDWYGAGPSPPAEPRIGPLAAGTYEVSAWIRNETESAATVSVTVSATVTVTVSGEPLREVQLVLE
jgi:hypothetical protein